MKEKYNALFEKLAPIRSDEELLRAVLDKKAENMSEKKRFNKKAIIIPAVATGVVLSTTIGVSAAYEWNLPAALSEAFNKTAEKTPEGVTFKEFNFTKVNGKELDYSMTFGDHEVQLKGVAADPHNVILFYDITFNGVEVKDNEYPTLFIRPDPLFGHTIHTDYNRRIGAAGTEENPALLSKEESDKQIHCSGKNGYGFLGMEGNAAHCYYWDYYSGDSLDNADLPLTFSNLGLYTETDDPTEEAAIIDRETYDESYDYTIDLSFIDKTNSVDVKTNTEITLSNGVSGKVSHIQITPFSACFCICWGNTPVEFKEDNDSQNPEALDAALVYDEFKVKLKDGTIMDKNAFFSFEEEGMGHNFRCRGKGDGENDTYYQDPDFRWLFPVDVADIEAIIVGNTTIPLN